MVVGVGLAGVPVLANQSDPPPPPHNERGAKEAGRIGCEILFLIEN